MINLLKIELRRAFGNTTFKIVALVGVAVAVGSFVAVVRKFQMVDRNLFRNTDFVAVPFKNPSLFSFLNIS